MGFKNSKAAVIAALRAGNFAHEARAAQEEKNLLAIGDVDAEFVARLVGKTMGQDYEESRHHWDQSVTVHTFKPTLDKVRWYIKAYFLEEAGDRATFISVHRSGS